MYVQHVHVFLIRRTTIVFLANVSGLKICVERFTSGLVP